MANSIIGAYSLELAKLGNCEPPYVVGLLVVACLDFEVDINSPIFRVCINKVSERYDSRLTVFANRTDFSSITNTMAAICSRAAPSGVYEEIIKDIYDNKPQSNDNVIFKAFKYVYDISTEDRLLKFLKSAN